MRPWNPRLSRRQPDGGPTHRLRTPPPGGSAFQALQGAGLDVRSMGQFFEKMQREIAELKVEGSAGGGMVTVTATGRQEIVAIRIEPSVIDPTEQGMLQDLVVAAVNLALRKSQELAQQELAKVTGGMPLPGLF